MLVSSKRWYSFSALATHNAVQLVVRSRLTQEGTRQSLPSCSGHEQLQPPLTSPQRSTSASWPRTSLYPTTVVVFHPSTESPGRCSVAAVPWAMVKSDCCVEICGG